MPENFICPNPFILPLNGEIRFSVCCCCYEISQARANEAKLFKRLYWRSRNHGPRLQTPVQSSANQAPIHRVSIFCGTDKKNFAFFRQWVSG
jgi:hypothetical protein